MILDLHGFSFRWSEYRTKQALERLIGEGMCWIDEQSEEVSYWFPSLYQTMRNSQD